MTRLVWTALLLLAVAAEALAGAAGDFARAAFSGAGGYEPETGVFEVVREFQEGNTTRINTYVDDRGLPISLGGRSYDSGFGVHADSLLRFRLPEGCVSFRAAGGIDDHVNPVGGSCSGSVLGDGRLLMASPVLRGDAVYEYYVPLKGVSVLELSVDNGGDGYTCDHWSWGDPRVEMEDGRVIYLSDMALQPRLSLDYPFSFTYGGKPSGSLLPGWDLKLTVGETGQNESLRTYVWHDPDTGLEVRAEVKIYADTNALDYTVYFTNKGEADTPVLSDICGADMRVKTACRAPVGTSDVPFGLIYDAEPETALQNDVLLVMTQGTIGCVRYCIDDFRLRPQYLREGSPVKVEHRGLTPCGGDYAPYWTLKWPGGGVSCGLGWTGSWQAEFDRRDDVLSMKAGRCGVNTYLKPGETIRSPRMVLAFFDGADLQEGMNGFRMTMIRHVSPKNSKGEPEMLPLACTLSGREGNSSTEAIDRAYIRSLAGLGFETVWFDAWYQQDGFPACMGNLHYPVADTADKTRYPHSLKPLTRLARAYGKTNLVWFGPETVNAGTYIAREHPEYVMWNSAGTAGSYALSDPEARGYLEDLLGALIREWDITYFRTDSSTDPACLDLYLKENAPDRQGISEDVFVRSLYTFWDDLRRQNPGLVIDNCAGGGTRLDPELMIRSINMARSDSSVWVLFDDKASAMLNQQITSNLNFYIPWSLCATLGRTPYSMRSCFNTGLAFIGDTREGSPDAYDKKELQKGLEECLRLRKYHTGRFYSLFSQDNTDASWCSWQYHRPETGDGYFVVFRREGSPFGSLEIRPRCLKPDADYRADIYESYDLSETRVLKGSELERFLAVIDRRPGSILVEYSPL